MSRPDSLFYKTASLLAIFSLAAGGCGPIPEVNPLLPDPQKVAGDFRCINLILAWSDLASIDPEIPPKCEVGEIVTDWSSTSLSETITVSLLDGSKVIFYTRTERWDDGSNKVEFFIQTQSATAGPYLWACVTSANPKSSLNVGGDTFVPPGQSFRAACQDQNQGEAGGMLWYQLIVPDKSRPQT